MATTSPPSSGLRRRAKPGPRRSSGASSLDSRRTGDATSFGSTGSTSAGTPASMRDGASRSLARSLLAGLQQAFAKLRLILGSRVEAGGVGQVVQAGEAEEALEQRGRPVDDGAEA